MEFTTRKSKYRPKAQIESDDLEALYPHNVMMYYLPPTQDITLKTFEEYAIERVNLLRILEQAGSKNLRFLSDEWKESVKEKMQQANMKSYLRLIDGHSTTTEADLQARRRDYISHFILRLTYCRSTELRRWFITRELEWFKYKFSFLKAPEIKKYLEINILDYQPISSDEKEEIINGLYDSTIHGVNEVRERDFYKVRFTDVPDLVRPRRCYLKGGYAYVISQDFVSIVAGLHEVCIEDGLTSAAAFFPHLENDERLVDLLKGLHTSYTGKDYAVSNKGSVPIECIDQLSKKSFPLCMRQCHEILRTKHHHKHFGRLQYGLFLKGIGVSLEDSLRFWRAEFTKMMDLDKFEKSYAYGIRYNYGKEGQGRNWAPWSCLKVISQSVGPQDTHGCPFKTLDANSLRAKLNAYGFATAHAQEIVGFASKGHYQIACGRYFSFMHSIEHDETINHPNEFFDKSQALIENRNTDGTPKSTQKSQNKDMTATKRIKQALMDEYDDELWNVSQQVELQEKSKLDTAAFQNDDDFDMSQMDKDF